MVGVCEESQARRLSGAKAAMVNKVNVSFLVWVLR